MPLDPESLRPAIRAILMASNLATVSTRAVRTELCKFDELLDPAEIKANKVAIDSIIAELFEDLREDTPPPEPAKKKIKKEKSGAAAQELADAKLARELSRSLNGLPPGRSTRGGGGAEKSTSSSKTKKSKKIGDGNGGGSKKVMSAAKVDSDGEPISGSVGDEDGNDGEAEAGKKRKRGGGGGAFNKEMGLSEQLSAVLDGESRLSRPQVVKRLWAYIKENELQDPKDKRYIFCDDPLKAIFKTPKIHMMTMNKTLSSHLYPLED